MLTYEQITSQIINSIKSSGLEPYITKHTLELVTLEKEFECFCVVENKTPPFITRAEISFFWDSTMTSESIYGGNCALYHDESEECLHHEENIDAILELEIKYNIEAKEGFKEDTNLINSELLKVINTVMEHQNKPQITWELTINSSGRNFINSIKVHHYWNIELDNEGLELEGIFDEVRDMLINIERLPFIKDRL